MPVISTLSRLSEEDLKFEDSLGYTAVQGQCGLHNETLFQIDDR
jgi:hypothetical protein